MAQPKPQQNEKQIQQNKQEREATSLDSGFPGGSMVKIPPANAGDTGDVGSIARSFCLFVTPRTVAPQVPLSMGFSKP